MNQFESKFSEVSWLTEFWFLSAVCLDCGLNETFWIQTQFSGTSENKQLINKSQKIIDRCVKIIVGYRECLNMWIYFLSDMKMSRCFMSASVR